MIQIKFAEEIYIPKPLCDAVILLAPVVSLSHTLPDWKYNIATAIAALFPRLRVPLSILSGEEAVQVTQGADNHDEQAATESPTLIINGGKDYFTPPQYVKTFCAAIPTTTKIDHLYFPNAYHLLMYDDQRKEIFNHIKDWLIRQK